MMEEGLKCQVCGKPATVHLTQIVENKIHKVDLCEDCADEKGVTNPSGLSLSELLAHPLEEARSSESSELRCEQCGLTPGDFKRTGRMGCPVCYDRFGGIVKPLLEQMHKGLVHCGKIPSLSLGRKDALERIGELEKALETAVVEERYEDAASARDAITKAKAELDEQERSVDEQA